MRSLQNRRTQAPWLLSVKGRVCGEKDLWKGGWVSSPKLKSEWLKRGGNPDDELQTGKVCPLPYPKGA